MHTQTHAHADMSTHMHTHMHACAHAHTDTHTDRHTHAHTHAQMCFTSTQQDTNTPICTYPTTHTFSPTHTHMHTPTHNLPPKKILKKISSSKFSDCTRKDMGKGTDNQTSLTRTHAHTRTHTHTCTHTNWWSLFDVTVLRMKNILWLDPLVQQTRLKNLKTNVISMIVRSELLKRGMADDNPDVSFVGPSGNEWIRRLIENAWVLQWLKMASFRVISN